MANSVKWLEVPHVSSPKAIHSGMGEYHPASSRPSTIMAAATGMPTASNSSSMPTEILSMAVPLRGDVLDHLLLFAQIVLGGAGADQRHHAHAVAPDQADKRLDEQVQAGQAQEDQP